MKVVINVCFGGFSLSPTATKLLAERRGRKCYFFCNARKPDGRIDLETYRGPISAREAEKEFMWYAFDVPNPNIVLQRKRLWAEMSLEERQESNRFYTKHSIGNGREVCRHDPDLLAVVRKLGKRANGKHAQLSVVTIPDRVKYQIEEYDGNEHIAEKHRTWE